MLQLQSQLQLQQHQQLFQLQLQHLDLRLEEFKSRSSAKRVKKGAEPQISANPGVSEDPRLKKFTEGALPIFVRCKLGIDSCLLPDPQGPDNPPNSTI